MDVIMVSRHTLLVGPIFVLAQDVADSDEALFRRFYHGMLAEGVYFAPSMYEAGFISSAHGEKEVRHTAEAAQLVLSRLCK